MIDMSRRLGLGLCAVALVTLMSACGGGSSEVTPASAPPIVSNGPPIEETPADVVSGIATPSSVSVVTATNSN
jgi:hypothetical protein